MIKKFFKNKHYIIALGAIIGSFLRWKIDHIFWINIIGCFLLGFVNKLKIEKNLKLLFGFSLAGSLTTFSAWLLDLFLYLEKKLYITFFKEVIIFILFGFISVTIGSYLGSLIIVKPHIKK